MEANARFYRVFETLDLGRWTRSGRTATTCGACIPGWGLLAGWEAVRDSWEAIFKNSQEMRFSITDVHAPRGGRLRLGHLHREHPVRVPRQVSVTSVLATNIFERSGGEWRLIHHHASHILAGDPSAGA